MNTNFHDEFMDNSDLADIDNLILSQAGSGDLVDKLQEKSEEEAAKKFDWMGEFKRHKFTYALLGLSMIFTVMLAVYLGLAPELRTDPETGMQYLYFHTDFGHLLTAFVYVLVFPAITEVAFAVARSKFKERETGNPAQAVAMFVAMGAAVISIIGTGVAGGFVVASTIGFLKKFAEIPDSVQNWIVWIIPTLLAVYAILYTIYELSSRADRAERFVKEQERRELLNHELRRRQIELAGKRKTQAAAIRLFESLIIKGVLSQTEAEEAMARGMSLTELEKRLNRDLTGEGRIGDTSGLHPSYQPVDLRPTPQPILQRAPRSEPSYRAYSLQEFLDLIGYSKPEAQAVLSRYGNMGAEGAWNLLKQYGMIPVDMAFQNFQGLYAELFPSPAPIVQPNGERPNP